MFECVCVFLGVADTKNFDFPQDLLDAQLELHRVQAELHALYARLPWSAEPLPGWSPKEGRSHYPSQRPDSPGWTEEDTQQVATVRKRQMELATLVVTHPFWATCDDQVAAHSALKHAHESASEDPAAP
jgi:hypothetical protein